MRKAIVIIGLCVAAMEQAAAQTNQIVTNAPVKVALVVSKPQPFVMPDTIATRSGKMYQGVKLQTVSSSEIIISYSDDEGVMQLENIKLADLPDDLQKHFGYDPKKAALEETKEQEQQKLWSSHAKLTPDQQRWYDYNENIKAQKEEEKREQIQAQMARQQWEDSLKERQVEAQEAAAAAALIQAQNPSQINIIQQQQQQQQQQ